MTSPTPETITIPRAGMLATVRNRRGVVAAVEPFDGETGRLHLVHLDYKDDHAPSEERILWEIEPSRHLVEPNALPNPTHSGGAMPAEDFDALVRAARWMALSPYLDPAGGEGPPPREPVASPFHGGVCVESYQLVPLLKALRMPRVSLHPPLATRRCLALRHRYAIGYRGVMETMLGSAIRQARKRARLTRSELSKRAGTSRSAIARYEAGHANPMLETARRLVAACGFDLRIELSDACPQRQAAADAALARSVEDRLRTNDSFTALVAQLRRE